MIWHDVFRYDSGRLYWKIKPNKNVSCGSIAGGQRLDGYWRVRFKKKLYYQHRIIYEMFHGEMPDGCEIDHADGDPSNNDINNLRLCSHRENMINHKLRRDSSTGVTGVTVDRSRNKYVSHIDGKFMGRFDSIEEAALARKIQEERRNPEFRR